MDLKQRNKALTLLRDIESLDATFVSAGISAHVIKITDSPRELVVRANSAGFVHIAREALRLALADAPGAHSHFDEAGMVDHCDKPVIFSRDLPNDV